MTTPRRLTETARLRIPAQLTEIAGAAEVVRRHLRARGLDEARWPGIELVMVEAMNNAIEHGTGDLDGAGVAVTVDWIGEELVIEVRDPGRFLPSPAWGQLPEDPLAEEGRGGFIITTGTDRYEHVNDDRGHALRLHWRTAPPRDPFETISESEETLAGMTEELSSAYETLTTMFGLSELLALAPPFDAFLQEALRRARTQLGGTVVYAHIKDESGQPQLLDFQADASAAPFVPRPMTPLETEVLTDGMEKAVEKCSSLPESEPLHWFPGGVVVMPVKIQGQCFGTVTLLKSGDSFFTAGQLELIRSVCDYVAVVRTATELSRQRELQLHVRRELEIAKGIQQSLLPRVFPEDERLRIYGQCLSAMEVGGDFFDVVSLPDGAVLLILADVMGKGLPAALLATVLRASVRARLNLAAAPGELLQQVNAQLHADLEPLNIFITAQLGWVAPDRRELRLASAGHCPVFVTHPTGNLRYLEGGNGLPIGILPAFAYTEERTTLDPGMRLVMVTDGLYEYLHSDGRLFGLGRLVEAIQGLRLKPPQQICTELLGLVQASRRGAGLMDDCTLVVMEIKA
jgi:serine phosphatase RsbU (regulator of sigma subunit)/anti-sigma regulatory factor (Ser/Thr protein kinase)